MYRLPESGNPFGEHEALLVGVSHYEDPRITEECGQIHQARVDAARMRDALISAGYSPSRVHSLFDDEASKKNITSLLTNLKKHEEIRLLIIYWAGHGLFDKYKNKNYLLPYDAKMEAHRSFLSIRDLVFHEPGVNPPDLALFIDTCYSLDSSFVTPALYDAWPTVMDSILIFAGASIDLAGQDLKGGFFTDCLIDGLTKCDTASRTGIVNLDELAYYIKREARVRDFSGFRINPYIFTKPDRAMPIGRNLGIFLKTELERRSLPAPATDLARRIVRKRWLGSGWS